MTISPSSWFWALVHGNHPSVCQYFLTPMVSWTAGVAIASSSMVAMGAIATAATPGSARVVQASEEFLPGEYAGPILGPILMSQLPPVVTLQRGSSGDAVSALQRRLSELGYYEGEITGYYGEQTEAAVKAFQQAQGMTPDGIVGQSTTEALRRAPSTHSRSDGGLTIGASGDSVSRLQSRLAELGYFDGPVTGYYGDLTASAVREFQAARGLAVDGVAGPATLSALDQAEQAPSSSSSDPDPNDGVLEQGETGPAVAELQRRLKNLNYYNGAIDGDFGSLTEDAVIRFQRSQGLVADGIVGPSTLSALSRLESNSSSTPQANTSATAPSSSGSQSAATPPPPPPVITAPPAANGGTVSPSPVNTFPPPSDNIAFPINPSQTTASQQAVMDLQRKLQDQGFYDGPIDGLMGPQTQQAIRAARNAYGVNSSDFGVTSSF